MGIDILGWVEQRIQDDWQGVLDAGAILERDYRLLGLLFGVRDHSILPLAEGRGLPEDTSKEVQLALAGYPVVPSCTWISWDEMRKLDWESGKIVTQKLTIELYLGKGDDPKFQGTTTTGKPSRLEWDEYRKLQKEGELRKDAYLYKVRSEPLEIPVHDSWRTVVSTMEQIGKSCGGNNCRMVVWFE